MNSTIGVLLIWYYRETVPVISVPKLVHQERASRPNVKQRQDWTSVATLTSLYYQRFPQTYKCHLFIQTMILVSSSINFCAAYISTLTHKIGHKTANDKSLYSEWQMKPERQKNLYAEAAEEASVIVNHVVSWSGLACRLYSTCQPPKTNTCWRTRALYVCSFGTLFSRHTCKIMMQQKRQQQVELKIYCITVLPFLHSPPGVCVCVTQRVS